MNWWSNIYDYINLIRNYRLLLKGRTDNAAESDAESQPLVTSSSSTSSRQSFGSIHDHHHGGLEQTSDTESCGSDAPRPSQPSIDHIPPVRLQKKLNRRLLFPCGRDTVELHERVVSQANLPSAYEISAEAQDRHGSRDSPQPIGTRTQGSIVTICSVWNTTVGTSLLAMPWGVEKTGLFPAIVINILIAAICFYMAYTILKVNEKHGFPGQGEVADLCKALIGQWAEIVAKIISIVVLAGANIVYWILMSNFLYNTGQVAYTWNSPVRLDSPENATVLCSKNNITVPRDRTPEVFDNQTDPTNVFSELWALNSSVPIYLGIVMFLLLNFKNPTCFTKLNGCGAVGPFFIIIFVLVKGYNFGIHLPDWEMEFSLKPTFFALSGMLSLSYFIHNIIISLMRVNRHQSNNGRDLGIAFGLVTVTYMTIGIVFYITFPLPKSCIEDNIFNNFSEYDTLTFAGRIVLLYQLLTVFPLISFMLRRDFFAMFNINEEHPLGKIMGLNLIIVVVCVLFACFLPKIGLLIRFTGALSGLVYVFLLPNLLKLASLKKEGPVSAGRQTFHYTIMLLGCANMIGQFFVGSQ